MKINKNETLERVLLMMKYDLNKTLSENSNVVKKEFAEQLNEAPPKITPRVGIKAPQMNIGAAKVARASSVTRLKNAAQNGPLNAAQRTQFGKDLLQKQVQVYASTKLPNGSYPTVAQQRAYAKQLVSNGTITNQINKIAGKNAGTPGTPATGTTGRTPRNKKTPTPQESGMIAKLKQSFTGANWKKIFAYVAGIGGVSAVVWYLFLRDTVNVSTCLLDNLTEEETLQLNGSTTGNITRTQVGNRIADLNGGLVFGLDNGQVTTGNGKYKGTYSCDGNNIKVKIAGAVFTIGGGASTDKGTGGGNGGGGQYKQCPETLPIAMYCKNSTVSRVQGCLGIKQDGAFGPLTSQGLVAKGIDGQSITQATIDKVCGGGVPDNQGSPITGDAEEEETGAVTPVTPLAPKTPPVVTADDADETS
jgi:hypothetical protein